MSVIRSAFRLTVHVMLGIDVGEYIGDYSYCSLIFVVVFIVTTTYLFYGQGYYYGTTECFLCVNLFESFT